MAKKKKTQKKKRIGPDYDSAWKEIIETHFDPFLELLFPHIHQDIDFSRGVEVKSKELRSIVPRGKVGKRHADVLVKVYLKVGTPKFFCVLIHVEVQASGQAVFMVRIFEYYYRIFEKYKEKGLEIVSLAVFTDEDPNNRPNFFHFSKWEFELTLKIPLVKIIDFRDKPEFKKKLENSNNPIALAVKVQLKSMEVKRKDINAKFNMKRELIRELYQHGYDAALIRSLFVFIDFLFPLPEAMDRIVNEDVTKYEEDKKMTPITSIERIAKKDGKKEGKIEGKIEGKKEGKREAKREMAAECLKKGFGVDVIRQLTKLPQKEIEKMAATVH